MYAKASALVFITYGRASDYTHEPTRALLHLPARRRLTPAQRHRPAIIFFYGLNELLDFIPNFIEADPSGKPDKTLVLLILQAGHQRS
jgi:hypothetical protein